MEKTNEVYINVYFYKGDQETRVSPKKSLTIEEAIIFLQEILKKENENK